MTPVDPFDREQFVEGGLRGVLAGEGTVTAVYYGDGAEYNYPGDVYTLTVSPFKVTKHQEANQVGTVLKDYTILWPYSNKKDSTMDKVLAICDGLGLKVTRDGKGFIGKYISFERKENKRYGDKKKGEEKKAE